MNIKSTWNLSEALENEAMGAEPTLENTKGKGDVRYIRAQAIGVHARKTNPMWTRLLEVLLPFDGNERSHVYVAIEGNSEVVKAMAERVQS